MAQAKPIIINMRDQQPEFEQHAPLIVWFVRLCLLAVVCIVGSFLVKHTSMALVGWIVFGGTIVLGTTAFVASFVRSPAAHVLVIVSVVTIALIYCLLTDALVLRGAWWQWFMLVAQMGIPTAVDYYIWKSPKVRRFFGDKCGNQ